MARPCHDFPCDDAHCGCHQGFERTKFLFEVVEAYLKDDFSKGGRLGAVDALNELKERFVAMSIVE